MGLGEQRQVQLNQDRVAYSEHVYASLSTSNATARLKGLLHGPMSFYTQALSELQIHLNYDYQ